MTKLQDAKTRLNLLREAEVKILRERHHTMEELVPWMGRLRECRKDIMSEENLIKDLETMYV